MLVQARRLTARRTTAVKRCPTPIWIEDGGITQTDGRANQPRNVYASVTARLHRREIVERESGLVFGAFLDVVNDFDKRPSTEGPGI
jgi:hypothetical protein